MWSDVKNLQLCRAIYLEYIREISGIRYRIKNYDNKVKCKCKAKDEDYEKIKRHLIIVLEENNI